MSPAPLLTRRACLGALAAFAATPALGSSPRAGLGALAARRGGRFGAIANHLVFARDSELAEVTVAECGQLTPEIELKWNRLRPSPTEFNFRPMDTVMQFAGRHNLPVRGHVLIWHSDVSKNWPKQYLTKETAPALFKNHIETVAKRYKGQFYAWDVINEAIDPEDGEPGSYRDSLWYRTLGPSHVTDAFHMVREIDPGVPLFYNDISLEYDTSEDRAHRLSLLRFLEKMKKQGVPIDGLGLQCHLRLGLPYDGRDMRRFVRRVHEMGYVIHITELDVNDVDAGGSLGARDRAAADHLKMIVEDILEEAPVNNITTWGISDRHSWLNQEYLRLDGSRLRPLPLDTQLKPKPMYRALEEVLQQIAG